MAHKLDIVEDVAKLLPKVIEAVLSVFDSSGFPEDWKAYFLSKVGTVLQNEAIKEAIK